MHDTFQIERPVLAVDVVMFRIEDGRMSVLLHQRDEEPFQGASALPGVAVRIDETLQEAAKRTLTEKVKWPCREQESIHLEQLATFDAVYRDPRGRTVSVAYMGLSRIQPALGEGGIWKRVTEMTKGSLPFDHDDILTTAVARLQGKLRYTNIAKWLLPETFRIEDIQEVYEAILGRSVNRTNFRNKLLKIHLIEQVRTLTEAVGKKGGRPPHLYQFTRDMLESVDREFL